MEYDKIEYLETIIKQKKQPKEAMKIEVLVADKQKFGILLIGRVLNTHQIVTIVDMHSKDKMHIGIDDETLSFKPKDIIYGDFTVYEDENYYNVLISKSPIIKMINSKSEDFEKNDVFFNTFSGKTEQATYMLNEISFDEIEDLIISKKICGTFFVKFTDTFINDKKQIKFGKRFVNLYNVSGVKINKRFAGMVLICIKGYNTNGNPLIDGYIYRILYIGNKKRKHKSPFDEIEHYNTYEVSDYQLRMMGDDLWNEKDDYTYAESKYYSDYEVSPEEYYEDEYFTDEEDDSYDEMGGMF